MGYGFHGSAKCGTFPSATSHLASPYTLHRPTGRGQQHSVLKGLTTLTNKPQGIYFLLVLVAPYGL